MFAAEPDGLRSIFLHNRGREGARAYAGELPHGLTFADRRRDVERKLGRPRESGGSETMPYYAAYPARGLTLEYETRSLRDRDAPLAGITLISPTDEPQDVPRDGPRLTFRLVLADGKADDPNAEKLRDPDDAAGVRTLLVSRDVALDESAVADVDFAILGEEDDRIGISMTMTADGANRLERFSRANQDRRVALVLDGEVLVAPTILGTVKDSLVIAPGPGGPIGDDVFPRLHAAVYALPR
jgi:hypothetical protein